jgi:hypothetical protein
VEVPGGVRARHGEVKCRGGLGGILPPHPPVNMDRVCVDGGVAVWRCGACSRLEVEFDAAGEAGCPRSGSGDGGSSSDEGYGAAAAPPASPAASSVREADERMSG